MGYCTVPLVAGNTYLGTYPDVLIDDVLTTGSTVRKYVGERPKYIAVLINRSDITEVDGIPVMSGAIIDKVAR